MQSSPDQGHRLPLESVLADNHLIKLLPRADRARLIAICEPVQFTLSEVICEPGQRMRCVYFPVDGFLSLVALLPGHPGLEVGMIGREGMLGAQLALGVAHSPLRVLVQGQGSALRVTAAAFRAELARSAALRQHVGRYLHVLMVQGTAAATCLRFHHIGPRLARWLLMMQDRAHADQFHVTQAFLAYMLGVRRVGISAAATRLQRDGLITYTRGEMTVRDRAGLEQAACSCYVTDLRTYVEQF